MTYEALGCICGVQNAGVQTFLFKEYVHRVNVVVAIRRKRDGTRAVSFNGHRAINMHDAVARIEKALSR